MNVVLRIGLSKVPIQTISLPKESKPLYSGIGADGLAVVWVVGNPAKEDVNYNFFIRESNVCFDGEIGTYIGGTVDKGIEYHIFYSLS